MNLSKRKAIFFDFDGVLVESVKLKENAFRTLFAENHADVVEEIIRFNRKLGSISRIIKIERIHRELLGKKISKSKLQLLAKHYTKLVESAVIACPEVRGAEQVLSRESKNASLFVVSGTPEDEMTRIVKARKWVSYFKGINGSPRLKDEIINDLLTTHNLCPSDCLFIGDTHTDLEAAHKMGVPFIGRRTTYRPNALPKNIVTVNDMLSLSKILSKNSSNKTKISHRKYEPQYRP